jgi:hypothetical protein
MIYLTNCSFTCIRPTLEYAYEVWDGCFEREVAKFEKVQLESARIVTGLTKFAKCIINYVLNTCVIVYVLQYPVSVIIISETMIIIQHQEVDSECLGHPLYHLLFRYGTI